MNIDLETTEAFCLRGLGLFLSFSWRWSHSAPHPIFYFIFLTLQLNCETEQRAHGGKHRAACLAALAAITHGAFGLTHLWLMFIVSVFLLLTSFNPLSVCLLLLFQPIATQLFCPFSPCFPLSSPKLNYQTLLLVCRPETQPWWCIRNTIL